MQPADFTATHPAEQRAPARPGIDGAAMRAELVAAGTLVPALGGAPRPSRFRALIDPRWQIDDEGLGRAAVELFETERSLVSRAIQHGDPRIAAALRRLVEREQQQGRA